jgi:hypothetical protein
MDVFVPVVPVVRVVLHEVPGAPDGGHPGHGPPAARVDTVVLRI